MDSSQIRASLGNRVENVAQMELLHTSTLHVIINVVNRLILTCDLIDLEFFCWTRFH